MARTDCSGRVVIEARAGLEFAVRLHACLLAGARAVPVDPRLSEHEREKLGRRDAATRRAHVRHDRHAAAGRADDA